MVDAGRQRDLAAQVGGLDLEAGQLVMLGPCIVHVIDEHQVRLAGLDAGGQDADPEVARRHLALHGAVLGADQRPFLVVLDGAHEGVGDQQAVVKVERLAVGITAGRPADLDELLDLGMVHRQVDRRRATAQRTLADRQRQRVHHADERHHARGLAVHADLFADRPQIAPVRADAAATRRQPHILVPQTDDAFERIVGLVQEAGDRQAAAGTAVAQHRRRRHEPEIADIVVESLGMGIVVGVGRGNARKHLLVAFVGQEIAIGQGSLAEGRQTGVPRGIGHNPCTASNLNDIKHGSPHFCFCPQLWMNTLWKIPRCWEGFGQPHYPLMIRFPAALSSPNFYPVCESQEWMDNPLISFTK